MNITSFLPDQKANRAVMDAAVALRMPFFSARDIGNLVGMVTLDRDAFVFLSVDGDGSKEAAIISDLRKKQINNMIYAVLMSGDADHEVIARLLVSGADQAEKWPVDGRLMVAQVKAILARPRVFAADSFAFAGVTVNFDTGDVLSDRGLIHFTPAETKIVKLICEKAGRVVTRDMIYQCVYADLPGVPAKKIIDVFICKIRKKLFAASGMDHIETRWGRGYVFVPDGFQSEMRDFRVASHRKEAAE